MLWKAIKFFIFVIPVWSLIGLWDLPVAISWDDDTTHRDLSSVAAQRSVLGTGYLETVLSMKDGLSTKLQWSGGQGGTTKEIRKWIEEGAKYEDAGGLFSGRFYNHFHNPIHQQPWTSAGLDDSVLGIPVKGESALRWAQNAGFSDLSNLDWSWDATRDYYYQALTTRTKAVREASMAKTFRGLGHLIHLIQDMGQPSHVRNDAHPEDFV